MIQKQKPGGAELRGAARQPADGWTRAADQLLAGLRVGRGRGRGTKTGEEDAGAETRVPP